MFIYIMEEYLKFISSGKQGEDIASKFLKSFHNGEMLDYVNKIFKPLDPKVTDEEYNKFNKLKNSKDWEATVKFLDILQNKYEPSKAPQIIDEAIEEVKEIIKKKRKPRYNRKDRPMPMVTKAVVQREIRPHEHHQGKWEKYELIQFYKTHGYVPPLKNGNPRKFDIEKELAKLQKAEEKKEASKKVHIHNKFPGPWRRHVGTWTKEEMYEYYKEWGVIPPTSAGKERSITLQELIDKINGVKRPKTRGLMSTKEVVGPREVKEKKKKAKKEEYIEFKPEVYEEPKRDFSIPVVADNRKIRDTLSKLYDKLRDDMTESERMKYTRLHKEQKFNELLEYMEEIAKRSEYIF